MNITMSCVNGDDGRTSSCDDNTQTLVLTKKLPPDFWGLSCLRVLIDEYDRASLGGQPVNITMSCVNGDDGRTSSGCDIAGVMILRRR